MAGRRWMLRVSRFGVAVVLAVGLVTVPELVRAAPSGPSGAGPGEVSVPVSAVSASAAQVPEMPAYVPPRAAWPAGGVGAVVVDAGSAGPARSVGADAARPGGLGVVARSSAADPNRDPRTPAELRAQLAGGAPGSLRVSVAGRAATVAAGVQGVVFTVERGDKATAAAEVALDVDYSGFAGMFGADFGARLGLVRLPACALTTPQRRECVAGTPVNGVANVGGSRVLSVDKLTVPGDSTALTGARSGNALVLAVTSGPSSGSSISSTSAAGGDFSQTSLAPSGSWSAGSQGGEFTYSYPIRVPPSVGGNAPSLALNYSSGSVDGRSLRSNSQASWVGMGWDLSVGYIERSFRSCSDDGWSSPDLCWYSNNATLSLPGQPSGKLVNVVQTESPWQSVWKAADENGLKIEHLLGSANQSTRGKYWKVTAVDGTQYFFGRGVLNRFVGDTADTQSAQYVPIYGNHAGEPCHISGDASPYAQRCWEVYRWNLDYVIDPDGNTTTYFYDPYLASYWGLNGTHGDGRYVTSANLVRIEYGTRAGLENTPAPAKVEFNQSIRCLPNVECSLQYQNWPDTPWDLYCDPYPGTCNDYSPSFWTPYKLESIVTSVRNASTGAYDVVDTYGMHYVYPSNGDHVAPAGDDTTPSLWLNNITHIASATGAGIVGGPVTLPYVHFGGNKFPNRVAWGASASGAPPLMHWRLVQVLDNMGGQLDVAFDATNCSGTNPAWPTRETNGNRCWPQYYNGNWVYFHKYVVNTVTATDLTGGTPAEVWDYDYAGWGSSTAALWRYDVNDITPDARRTWSDWRGYPIVATTHGSVTGQKTVTRDHYYRGFEGDRNEGMGWRSATLTDTQGVTVYDSYPLAGRLRERTLLTDTGIQSTTITDPLLTYVHGLFPNYSWQTRDQTVRSGTWIPATSTWRWTKQTYEYDTYALPTKVSDHGDEAVTNDETCTTTSYARNTTSYLIDYPSQAITRSGPGCAAGDPKLAESKTFYDGSTTLGAAPTKGKPTKVQTLVSTGPDVWATTEAAYDAYGRPTSTKDARGKTGTVAYTPTTGGPVTQMTATNPLGHVTATTLHPGLGVPVTVTDPNAKVTTARYDASGRLVKVWRPGHATSGTPTTEYVYTLSNGAANAITTKAMGPNGNQIVTYQLFDGRLRPRQTQQPAPQSSGGRIINDTVYDARGLVVKTSNVFNSSAPAATLVTFVDTDVATQGRYTYDQLGRVTADQFWANNVKKWETTTSYGGDRTQVTPPTGGIPTTTLADAHGRTVQLRQHLGATTAAPYQTTSYTYDRLDRLTQMTDPAGNKWTTTYDLAGRVTATTDPDKGANSFVYNAAGDLTSTTDARSVTLAYKYDDLGRKTELWQGSVGGSGTKRATWHYDTLTGGGSVKGLPVRSTRWHPNTSGVLEAYSSEVAAVDDAYRPLSSTVTLPASMGTLTGPWTASMTYKPDGQVATRTLPAAGSLPAETITHSYDNAGYPTTMVGLDAYISNTSYTGRGKANKLWLGTGTKRVTLENIIDSPTQRVTETRVATENQTTPNTWVPQLIEQYGYDNAGNIKNIKEVDGTNTVVSNQCFGYDTLRQLTEAWTTTATTCQATPSQPIVGGPDPYWTSYTYNSIGNRTTDTVHTPGGNTTRTYAYPTSGPTAVRPHATTGVTITGLNPGTDTYTYDNTGNTTTRNLAGKPTQTLTWDPEGHLATVTDSGGTTSYVYTPDGQRLLAYEPGPVTTLYLGDIELRRTTTGITCTRHYGVASRTTSAGLTWTAADHHGTGQMAINPTTLATTRRKTDPYGNQRGPAAAWPTTRGFVNGTQDPTGLTHLGAREYEPQTGRFISVDPIMNLTDPTQWNGYTYANNNPTTLSDPDGLDPCPGGGGGCYYDGTTERREGEGRAGSVTPAEAAVAAENTAQALYKLKLEAKAKELYGRDYNRMLDADKREVQRQVYCDYDPIMCQVEDCISGSSTVPCTPELIEYSEANPAVPPSTEEIIVMTVIAVVSIAAGGLGPKPIKPTSIAPKRAFPSSGRVCQAFNSFDPDTPVLMADGTTKTIKDIKVGDTVLATDPETGQTAARPVTALHRNLDHHLTDITIANTDGATAILETTAEHPFWNVGEQQWTLASDLTPGEFLHTPTGTTVTATAVRSYGGAAVMYNLTIHDIPTYYVIAGNTPVLVHNTQCTIGPEGWNHVNDFHRPGGVGVDGSKTLFAGRSAEVRDLIQQTVQRGRPQRNTGGRDGTVYEWDFGRPVGTRGEQTVRVVVNPDGTLRTAFPI